MKDSLVKKYYVDPSPDLNIGVTRASPDSYRGWVPLTTGKYNASLFDTKSEAIEEALKRVNEWVRASKEAVERARKEYEFETSILAENIKLRTKIKKRLKP